MPIDTNSVDWLVLKDLEHKTSAEVIKNVVDSFLLTLPETINDIKTAELNKDLKKISFFAHRLSASSAALGAKNLFNFCKIIEDKCDSGLFGIDELKSTIRDFYTEAEKVCRLFEEHRKSSES